MKNELDKKQEKIKFIVIILDGYFIKFVKETLRLYYSNDKSKNYGEYVGYQNVPFCQSATHNIFDFVIGITEENNVPSSDPKHAFVILIYKLRKIYKEKEIIIYQKNINIYLNNKKYT